MYQIYVSIISTVVTWFQSHELGPWTMPGQVGPRLALICFRLLMQEILIESLEIWITTAGIS